MRRSLATLVLLAGLTPLTAQEPAAWLAGTWAEVTKQKAAPGLQPAVLQVATGNGLLRIAEDGADGMDLRCRLDGTESVYRQARPAVTFDFMLECEIGPRAVDVTGFFTATGVEGFPPREFELRKRYELAPDGSLRRQDQLWGIIPGIGRAPLRDGTTSFRRGQ